MQHFLAVMMMMRRNIEEHATQAYRIVIVRFSHYQRLGLTCKSDMIRRSERIKESEVEIVFFSLKVSIIFGMPIVCHPHDVSVCEVWMNYYLHLCVRLSFAIHASVMHFSHWSFKYIEFHFFPSGVAYGLESSVYGCNVNGKFFVSACLQHA